MTKNIKALLLETVIICALFAQEGRSAVTEAASSEIAIKNPMIVEADEISYDEQTAQAVAVGHVAVKYADLLLYADRIILASDGNVIKAYASEGKQIIIKQNGSQTLKGRYLEYHVNESEGKLEAPEAVSQVPYGNVYVKSESLDIADVQSAYEKKWLHGKNLKKTSSDDMAVQWHNVSYTTCPLDKPHYQLKSKKAVMVPNRFIMLHNPRFYAGSTYILTVPFNMWVHSKKKAQGVVTVSPNYDNDKKVGLVAKTEFFWKTGKVNLEASYWTEGIFEYGARVDQKVTDWLSVYAVADRSYDDDLKDTKNRPRWGALMSYAGWNLEAGWAEREKRSVVRKPGQKEYETTLWRRPDINITSPWAGVHTGILSQYFRLKANYGSYQETGTNLDAHGDFIERYGWGADYYTELPFRLGSVIISPFIKGDYWNYGYKNDTHDRQIISIATYGIRANCGIFELGSAYTQKRVSGHSAFVNGWDANYDTDTFYQRVGVKVGRDLTFSVQGIWDMTGDINDLSSVGYSLSYDNNCCTRWVLTYNDDVSDQDSNNWVTFSFAINAFPDTQFKVGTHALNNPFGRPGGLPAKRKNASGTLMEREGTELAEENEIKFPVFDI